MLFSPACYSHQHVIFTSLLFAPACYSEEIFAYKMEAKAPNISLYK